MDVTRREFMAASAALAAMPVLQDDGFTVHEWGVVTVSTEARSQLRIEDLEFGFSHSDHDGRFAARCRAWGGRVNSVHDAAR